MRTVYFDLETGGLDPTRHPVIQFAGIAVEGWEPVGELELKIHFDPTKAEPEALGLNSFDADTWAAEAVRSSEAVAKIGKFLREHARVDVPKKPPKIGTWRACQLAGYNAATFDRPFLGELFRRHDAFCVGTLAVLDVYQLVQWWATTTDDRPENLRLETVAPFLGIEHGEAHDALGDVRATIAVAKLLMEGAWR